MEATYIGFNMWVKAVEKVKSTDADKVIDALPGTKTPNLTGGVAEVLAYGVPVGLGSHVHWDRKLDSLLAGEKATS